MNDWAKFEDESKDPTPIGDRYFEDIVKVPESDFNETHGFVSINTFERPGRDGNEAVFNISIGVGSQAHATLYMTETQLKELEMKIKAALEWCQDCREDFWVTDR